MTNNGHNLNKRGEVFECKNCDKKAKSKNWSGQKFCSRKCWREFSSQEATEAEKEFVDIYGKQPTVKELQKFKENKKFSTEI